MTNRRWLGLGALTLVGLFVLYLSFFYVYRSLAEQAAPTPVATSAPPTETPAPAPTALPSPTVTPAPSATAHLSPTATPGPLVQLAWFYKPPSYANRPLVAQQFSVFILTHRDEHVRDQLREQGATAPFLQYLHFDTIHDPGACDAKPLGNQVATLPGDFCEISSKHPDWFLLDVNGKRMVDDDGEVMMDPGNPGWREFWLERTRQLQEKYEWDGVFLDNVEASLAKRRVRHGLPAAYPDDLSYQAAVEGFLDYIYSNYFQPEGRPLYANIIALEDQAVWFRYLQHLDGAMEESFSVQWDENLSPDTWEAQLERIEQTQALGKGVILVGQGGRNNERRQVFTFASYLLISQGRAAFRYTQSNRYSEFWQYPTYDLDLGEPVGPRYQRDGLWRRDFTNGSVSVNPSHHTAEITLR